MKIHPDGTLEGSPEELSAYKMKGDREIVYIERPVYVPYQPWYQTPVNPYPWDTVICDNVDFFRAEVQDWNLKKGDK